MFPILFSIGQFQLRTISIFFVMAFLASGFVFWRKGREEHYSETQLFDGFLLSAIFGFIVGRIGYILMNFSQFSFDLIRWVDLLTYPGNHLLLGLLGSTLYLVRFAHKKKWDLYEILDFWVLATAVGSIFRYLGYFFDGTLFGKATNLPWGIIFPGVFEKRHPVQLYFAIFYLILFWFLSHAEYRYRTYEWYRAGKKSAQTGFLLSVFVMGSAFFTLIMSFFRNFEFVWGGVAWDVWLYFAILVFGVALLINRSGRKIFPDRKKKVYDLGENDV